MKTASQFFGKDPISISEPLTVKELAAKLELSEVEIIKHLFHKKHEMRTVNQIVEVPLAREVVVELGFELGE